MGGRQQRKGQVMNLLETFYVLFKGDNEDLKKSAEENEKALDDLEQKMTATDVAGEKLGLSLGKVAGQASAAAAGITALLVAASTSLAVKYADQLNDLSESLKVNVSELDAWQQTLKKSGGSAGAFQKTIANLNDKLFVFGEGGKADVKPFFDAIGLSVLDANKEFKNAIDLLPDLAEKFESLDNRDAKKLADKLGLDRATFQLLLKGRQAVEDQIRVEKELGVVRAIDAERSDDLKDAYEGLTRSLNVMGSRYMFIMRPIELLLEALGGLARWMGDNADFVIIFFTTLTAVVVAMFTPAIIAATAAMWAFLVPFLPWLAIAALVIAGVTFISLALQDMYTWFQGGKSIIGEFVGTFEGLAEKIKKPFEELKTYISTWLSDQKNKITGFFEFLKNPFGGGGGEIIINSQAALAGAAASPLGSQTSGVIQSGNGARTSSVEIGEIQINTQATDADGISQAIGQTLRREIDQVTNDFDDGVGG